MAQTHAHTHVLHTPIPLFLVTALKYEKFGAPIQVVYRRKEVVGYFFLDTDRVLFLSRYCTLKETPNQLNCSMLSAKRLHHVS